MSASEAALSTTLALALALLEREEVIDFNGHFSARLPHGAGLLINAGDGVWYHVVTRWIVPLGSPLMTFETAPRNAGSVTFIDRLE